MTRPAGEASGTRQWIAAVVWAVMMLVWLAGLGYGVWWVWPHFERLTITSELLVSVVWLVFGVAAWILALSFGLQRYGPRGPGRKPPRPS